MCLFKCQTSVSIYCRPCQHESESYKIMNPHKHTLQNEVYLLRDLPQISPSLNKHQGVFARQLHSALRERQA